MTDIGEATAPATGLVDCHPPYLWPDYAISVRRAPRLPLVELPREWHHDTPGPPTGRLPLGPEGGDLTKQHEGRPIGQRIVVNGRVLDRDGRPVPGAVVEIWQTNAAGHYVDDADPGYMPLDPNFTGAARLRTDAEGRFRLVTVKPAAYAQEQGSLYRPAHLHVSVLGHDLSSRVITQCYFEGDPLVGRDPIVGSIPEPRGVERMIARFDDAQTESGGYDSAIVYSWEIVLRGRAAGVGDGRREAEDDGAQGDGGSAVEDAPAELVASPSQTSGPLYGFSLLFEGCERAVDPGSPGALRVEGQMVDGDDRPVAYPDGFVELWQGEQFARARTDSDGRYSAVIAKPSVPPLPDGRPQAPHLNVAAFARGLLKQAQTRIYFPDEQQANEVDPVLERVEAERRGTLIARQGNGRLRFDLRLQGEGETVFLDF